jgi:Flp pilus assembly protein TadG
VTGIRCFRGLRNLLIEFCRANGGNISVYFALAAIPIIGAIGGAVDFSKANDVKARLQNSLDAAVLAGVTQASAQQISTATAVFNGDYSIKYGATATPSFTQNADGSLSGTVSTSVNLSFLTILGMSSIPATAAATATPGAQATSKVCILLVNQLDYQALLVNSCAQINAPSCEIHVASTQNPAAMFNATLNVKRTASKGPTSSRTAASLLRLSQAAPPSAIHSPASCPQ